MMRCVYCSGKSKVRSRVESDRGGSTKTAFRGNALRLRKDALDFSRCIAPSLTILPSRIPRRIPTVLNWFRTLFGNVQGIAHLNSDDFRLSNANMWTEPHHTKDGGSFQRMRLEDGNIVFLSVSIMTVKVFVTPLEVSDLTQFRE